MDVADYRELVTLLSNLRDELQQVDQDWSKVTDSESYKVLLARDTWAADLAALQGEVQDVLVKTFQQLPEATQKELAESSEISLHRLSAEGMKPEDLYDYAVAVADMGEPLLLAAASDEDERRKASTLRDMFEMWMIAHSVQQRKTQQSPVEPVSEKKPAKKARKPATVPDLKERYRALLHQLRLAPKRDSEDQRRSPYAKVLEVQREKLIRHMSETIKRMVTTKRY